MDVVVVVDVVVDEELGHDQEVFERARTPHLLLTARLAPTVYYLAM